VLERTLYITIDEKPKRRPGAALKRLRNIAENPAVAVIVDRYDEDWARLGWVMLRGQAEILREGREHRDAQALLRSRYPQVGTMETGKDPVIAGAIERQTSWGNPPADPASQRPIRVNRFQRKRQTRSVPSPACGGGTGRGHTTRFMCASSPPPQPSPASG